MTSSVSSSSNISSIDLNAQNTNVMHGPECLHICPPYHNATAVGFGALKYFTGYDAVGIGYMAASKITTANGITAIGSKCLQLCTVGDDNTGVGYEALHSTSTGIANTGTGKSALMMNEDGTYNSAYGLLSLALNVHGKRNCVFGAYSGYGILGDDNCVVGNDTQRYQIAVSRLCVFGNGACQDNQVSDTSAFGFHALHSQQSGTNNSAYGVYCLEETVSGSNNTGVGSNTLRHSWGSDNTITGAMGMSRGNGNGSENDGSGSFVLLHCIGNRNTAHGCYSMKNLTTGYSNAATGYASLSACVDGARNATFGASSGKEIIHKDGNSALGFGAGPAGDFENTLCLGCGARALQDGEFALGSVAHPLNTTKMVSEVDGDAAACPTRPHMYLSLSVNGESYVLPLYKSKINTHASSILR